MKAWLMISGPTSMEAGHDFPSNSTANAYTEACATLSKPKPSRDSYCIQRALRGIPDFLHVLSQDGRIRYASDSCRTVVGHEPDRVTGRRINDFVHPDDLGNFVRELTGVFVHGNSVRFIYRFWNSMNDWTILESQCNAYWDGESHNTPGYRELIIMARPYINKSSVLLDSFLEHKFAYDVLVRHKRQLAETEDVADDQQDDAPTWTSDGVCVAFVQPKRKERAESHIQVETAAFTPGAQTTEASKVSGQRHVLRFD
jgi:hypothetical protein